ncbi:MAG: methyltransferase [Gemmatimonadota bacterium]
MSRKEEEGRPRGGRPSSQGDPAPPGGGPWAPLDRALAAYLEGSGDAVVLMRTDAGGEEEVPVALFFRRPEEMGPVEATALAEARGRVFDLGAGPGAHAVPLSRRGLLVTAAEVLPRARDALVAGGVGDVRAGGLETLRAGERFDTILVLMNGAGLAGSLDGLQGFLVRLAGHLAEGGRLLLDSTDPRAWEDPGDGRYPGEVHMQLGFEGEWGEPFPFLFVDAGSLRGVAASVGLDATVVAEEDGGRYLARVTPGRPAPAP